MELAHLDDVHLGLYLEVNELITDKMQNLFYLVDEHAGFIDIV